MKIALVNPNYKGSLESKRTYIPLGLASLAAMIKKSGRHKVKVIDAAALDMSNENLERELKEFMADVVGTCAVTTLLRAGLNVCKIAKRLNMKTILGGVHATILPEETICFDEVDIIAIGEGEYTLTELLDFLEQGKNLEKVKGIMFKKIQEGKVKIIKTKPREKIKNLDELPFPARELFPLKLCSSYGSLIREVPSMHVMTSRGCPNRCTFCASRTIWGGCVNMRSPKSIVDEMELLVKKFGAKEIYLYDDTFNLNIKRSEEICDEIIKRKIKIALRVQARVHPLTKRLLSKMKKAGVWCILYGVESGNQEVLNDMRKGITLDQARKAFKITHETGIRTLGFFMIGLPKDNKKTIQETLNFSMELNPDFASFSITTLFPGTEIYELAVKEGSIQKIKPKEFFKPQLYKNPSFRKGELEEELSKIYKKFYLRPYYMLRRFLRIRTYMELKSNILAGIPFLNLKGNPLKVSEKWVPVEKAQN